jgi:hypothetical protein
MASKWPKRGRRWYFSAGLLTAISPLCSACAPTPVAYYPPIVGYSGGQIVVPPRPDYRATLPDISGPPTRRGDQGSVGSSAPWPDQQTPQGRAPTATPPTSEPAPMAPNKEAESHSPTCGNWRFGCGILWP